jgi:hypothetical protein
VPMPPGTPPLEYVPKSPIPVGGQSAEAAAWQAERVAAPGSGPSLRPGDWVKPGTAAAPEAPVGRPLAQASYNAGRAVGSAASRLAPAARVLGKIAPPIAAAEGLSHVNDYKLDEPGVDSSLGGTLRAVGSGDFAGAYRSAAKGAKEAAMDVGSFFANAADPFVPGKAPVSAGYNRSLREIFGDKLITHPSVYDKLPPQDPPVDMTPNDTPRGTMADLIARGAPAQPPGEAAQQQAPEQAPGEAAQPEETLRAPDRSPGAIAWSVIGGEAGRGTRYMTNDGRAITEPDLNNADAQAVSEFNNPTQQADTQAAQAGLCAGAGGTSPVFEQALAAEGITGAKADLARAHYMQESGAGRNTTTSNAGAVGGMQILPGTFAENSDKGWDINNPEHNARAGIRYVSKMYDAAKGDPVLAAAGYYGGLGGMDKARKGVAVADPRNPNAPNTLQYAQQVAARAAALGGQGAAQQPQQQAAQQRGAASGLRNGAVGVIEGAGNRYYEVPDGAGGYQKVGSDTYQAGLRAKGGLQEVLGDVYKNEQEGTLDKLNPNKIEREKLAVQSAQTRAQMEQAAAVRQFEMHKEKRVDDRAAEDHLHNLLTAKAPTMADKDGKKAPDADWVSRRRESIDRALARKGYSASDLDTTDRERLLAGADLLEKVNAEATNWPIPWHPDYLKTIDAMDMIGIKRLDNGDARMPDKQDTHGNVVPGQVIPKRFIDKVGADYFYGKPTNRYDMITDLRAKK